MLKRSLGCLKLGLVALLVLVVVASSGAQEVFLKDAQQLYKQVLTLRKQGRYADAIPLAQRVLAICEDGLGSDHPVTASSLNNLAGLYQATGANAKAEPLYQRALAIREKVLGPEHPGTAASLNNLAELYRATGAYAKAEPLYRRALAIHENVLGPEHPATATSLNNLALLYHTTGAYAQAEPLMRRALAIDEASYGPEHPETATSLNNLAGLYQAQGRYAEAEPLYQRALRIKEKVLGAEHPATAASLNNLAELYRATGAYAKAEPLYRRALAIDEKTLGPEHPATATSLNNLALLYRTTGAYAQAEPLYRRALAIREKALGSEHPETATSLNNLAGLYAATGAYAQAEPLMRRALAIDEASYGPEHPETATSMNNLALLYHRIGVYAQAEALYQRALAIKEKVLGAEHPATAQSLNNLAGLYEATGAYAKAEPLYQRALAIRGKMLGPEHPDTAQSLNNMAVLYHATGAYAQAEQLYQRVLAIHKRVLGSEHPDTATSFGNLAVGHWAAGKLAQAVRSEKRAQAIHEKNMRNFLFTGSETRKQAYVQRFRGSASGTISHSLAGASQEATVLGLTSVLLVKGRVLDAMADSVAKLRQSVKPEDRALFDRLTAVAQQRSTLTYQGLGNLSPEVYRARLRELAEQQERLEAELSTRSGEFRRQVAPVTLARVQEALPEDVALIEWFRYESFDPKAKEQKARFGKPRYVAYVVRREGEPHGVDFGEAEAIERLVRDFRTGLSDPKTNYVKELAKELYDKLVKPIHPHLGNVKRLLISPDAALNLIPFAALMDETAAYLVTRYDITYLTSGRDLLRFDLTAEAKDSAVVVADPDYGPSSDLVAQDGSTLQPSRSVDLDRGGMVFTPLPGTKDEARILRSLLKVEENHLLTQANATEAKLKELHSPRTLHIATHGFFLKDNELPTSTLRQTGFSLDQQSIPLGENPLLRSGLALAGANARRSGENDDGILTAAEVAQLDLRGTQLVVLSACETGVGEVQNGEGVYGLRRVLVLAGAETQVTSLWKVADEATKDLMVEYYQRLLKGEGRSEALRHTQLTMINSNDRAHPYYWAAFVPIGDWRPLSQTR